MSRYHVKVFEGDVVKDQLTRRIAVIRKSLPFGHYELEDQTTGQRRTAFRSDFKLLHVGKPWTDLHRERRSYTTRKQIEKEQLTTEQVFLGSGEIVLLDSKPLATFYF